MEQQHRTMIAAIQRGQVRRPERQREAPERAARRPRSRRRGDGHGGPRRRCRRPDRRRSDARPGHPRLPRLRVDPRAARGRRHGRGGDGGRKAGAMRLKAQSSVSRQPVAGASVQMRILSTVSKPAGGLPGQDCGRRLLRGGLRRPGPERRQCRGGRARCLPHGIDRVQVPGEERPVSGEVTVRVNGDEILLPRGSSVAALLNRLAVSRRPGSPSNATARSCPRRSIPRRSSRTATCSKSWSWSAEAERGHFLSLARSRPIRLSSALPWAVSSIGRARDS